MPELTMGDILFESTGDNLRIAGPNQSPIDITLGTAEIEALLQFLHSLSAGERNRRSVFRIAVRESFGLSAYVRRGETKIDVKPVNLGFTGVQIEFRGHDDVLTLGDVLDVVFGYEGESCTVAATVSRRDMDLYGLSFLDAANSSVSQSLSGITEIVMSLQRKWLTQHRHLMN